MQGLDIIAMLLLWRMDCQEVGVGFEEEIEIWMSGWPDDTLEQKHRQNILATENASSWPAAQEEEQLLRRIYSQRPVMFFPPHPSWGKNLIVQSFYTTYTIQVGSDLPIVQSIPGMRHNESYCDLFKLIAVQRKQCIYNLLTSLFFLGRLPRALGCLKSTAGISDLC